MISAFFKDGFIYSLASLFSRGLSFLLLPVYTRIFSPSDYGVLDLFLTFGSLVHLTVALEISQGVARYYGEASEQKEKSAYASSAFWFTFITYTVFLVLGLIYASHLSLVVTGKPGFENFFRIGLVYLWVGGLFNLIQNLFRWSLQSKAYALGSFLVSIVTLTSVFLMAVILKLGLIGVIGGMIAGSAVGFCFCFIRQRENIRLYMDPDKLKRMLHYSLPLVPSSVAVFIAYYIDRIMIRHFLTLEDVGLYGIAFRLASISSLVMVGFQGALTPLIYTHYKKQETPGHIATIFRVFICMSLMVFAGLSLFSKEILWVMTTPPYYSAYSIVIFLVPALLLSCMYIFAPGIDIERKTHFIFFINLAGAVLNTVLNWFMIPAFGVIGACIATLLNYTMVFTAYMTVSQKLYPIPHQWKNIFISVIGAVIAVGVGLSISINVFMDVVIKLVLFAACIPLFVASGLIKRSEINDFMKLLRDKSGAFFKKSSS